MFFIGSLVKVHHIDAFILKGTKFYYGEHTPVSC